MRPTKPTAKLYLSKQGETSSKIQQHLARHIDFLNQFMNINFIYVDRSNVAAVKRLGIHRTPTLTLGDKVVEGVDAVIRALTPRSPPAAYSDDDTLQEYYEAIIDSSDDEVDEIEDRKKEIQTKMAAMQKRRPAMDGVPTKNKTPGGRPTKKQTRPTPKKEYNNDDAFLQSAGQDNVAPSSVENENGDLLLENYFLQEAHAFGKK